jgi:hypothetical protein
MKEAMRASLAVMGNPYAKLSILDDEELAQEAATAQLSCAKGRHLDAKQTTPLSLIDLQNPYAKLSILSEEELALESDDRRERTDLLWKTRTQVYQYVSEAFTLPFLRTRPPELLRQFGKKVIRLSPRAQSALHRRIAAHLPDEHIVYNRLSPKELEQLLVKLLEMADEAKALDGQEG